MDRNHARFLAALSLVLAAILYGGHIAEATFVAEDGRQVGSWLGMRGLSNLSWWMPHAPQHHYLSFVLHMVNAALVVFLAQRVGLSEGVALVAGAIFLLHPLSVQAVAYASARTELIAACGVLTACLVVGWTPWRLGAAALAVLVGLGGKESAGVALLLFPLVAGVGFVWFGLVPLAPLLTLVNVGEDWLARVTWFDWLSVQSTAVIRLMSLALVPQGLTIDYDYDRVPAAWQVVSVGLLLSATWWALWLRRRRPVLAIGVGWMLLAVLPRLIVQTPRSYLNEHQFYLPLVGLAVAGASVLGGSRARV